MEFFGLSIIAGLDASCLTLSISLGKVPAWQRGSLRIGFKISTRTVRTPNPHPP
jgi:hypothetical protein